MIIPSKERLNHGKKKDNPVYPGPEIKDRKGRTFTQCSSCRFMPSLRNLSTDYYRWKKLAESSMIDGLKPRNKKEKKLTKREQELIKENERLQAVIIQLTKEHLELKKKVQESE